MRNSLLLESGLRILSNRYRELMSRFGLLVFVIKGDIEEHFDEDIE